MKKLLLFFLVNTLMHSQWIPTNPLRLSAEDCPFATRLCNASQSYNFQLTSWGSIDDAHGSLVIPLLANTSANRFESRVSFLKFTPNYSGQMGFVICPESFESYQFQLFLNPNCSDLETGAYSSTSASDGGDMPEIADQGCKGIGINPVTGLVGVQWTAPLENIIAGATYILFIQTVSINQPGTHRFTLQFTGPLVAAHPDLFTQPECNLAAEEFVLQEKVKVFPNPFNTSLRIESSVVLKKLELYNALGKQILKQGFANQLDTSTLAKGVYLLKLFGDDGVVYVRKVVKE